MLSAKLCSKISVVASFTLISFCSNAGGGGGLSGGATEFTQMMNNGELITVASSSTQQAITQANQYVKQIEQWQMQVRNLATLKDLPQGITQAVKSYNDYVKLRNSLTNLYGSLNQEKAALENRFTEANLLHMGWSEYQAAVAKDVAAKKQKAVTRMEQEQAILDQVQEDYTHAREMQDKVATTDGMHGALQLMNEQMNKLIVQNARLMQVITTTQMADSKTKIAEEAESAEKRRLIQDYLIKQEDAIRQRQSNFGAKTN